MQYGATTVTHRLLRHGAIIVCNKHGCENLSCFFQIIFHFFAPFKNNLYICTLTLTNTNKTMYSDPKDCLYCTNNETLHNLMIEIAHLRVSRVFLFKEQTYHGRCLVSYDKHVNDLNELTDEERNDFMADVAQTTRAMQKAFNPEKINYGAYSDKLSHLHFHLAPKYVDGPDYGGTFQMNPGKVYLTDAEYQEMIEKIKSCL